MNDLPWPVEEAVELAAILGALRFLKERRPDDEGLTAAILLLESLQDEIP